MFKNFWDVNKDPRMLKTKWGASLPDCIDEAEKYAKRSAGAVYFPFQEKIYCIDSMGRLFVYILEEK